MTTHDPTPVAKLAASVLQSDRARHDVVELMCEVVIAQSRVNVWSAGAAKTSSTWDETAWLRFLEDFDRIEGELLAAGDRFLTTSWPQGDFAKWQEETTRFLSSLRCAFEGLNELGTGNGRKNHIALRPNDV